MTHSIPTIPPKLSLLHATRGRPEQASACREQWLRLASCPEAVEHIFAVDIDDTSSHAALAPFIPIIVNNPGGGCVAAWNMAAAKSTGDVLIQLSDDWIPPQGWDRLILNAIGESSKPSVLRVSDGHRTDDLLCMAILTRARLEQQVFLFSSEYQGVYSDDEFSFRACKDGVIIHAPEIRFTHAHPHYDSSVKIDQTYLVQNSEQRTRSGMMTFARRNPDAFGQWIHHGTDQRRYLEAAVPEDIQAQLIQALSEIERLLEKESYLLKCLTKETAMYNQCRMELDRWKTGVVEWNQRTWFSRAVHKLRISGGCSNSGG